MHQSCSRSPRTPQSADGCQVTIRRPWNPWACVGMKCTTKTRVNFVIIIVVVVISNGNWTEWRTLEAGNRAGNLIEPNRSLQKS